MLLADAAQVADGKLYILGGGWSFIDAPTPPMAVATKLDVDWDQTNRRHVLELTLADEDGHPTMIPTPVGERQVAFHAEFEVGRPPGLRPGTPIDVPLAISFGPLPLRPDTGYVWQLTINGEARDDWRLSFRTRPAHAQPAGDA